MELMYLCVVPRHNDFSLHNWDYIAPTVKQRVRAKAGGLWIIVQVVRIPSGGWILVTHET